VNVCSTVQDFLLVQDYEAFATAIGNAVGLDPNVSQLALCYRLTHEIIKVAATSNTGQKLVGWTRTYFRQKLAPWLVTQNGLVRLRLVMLSEFTRNSVIPVVC
jgi:hypothetical protein